MAVLDRPLMQQVLDIPQRQGKRDAQHRCQAKDLRARLEILKGGAFAHPGKIAERPPRQLTASSSDNTRRDSFVAEALICRSSDMPKPDVSRPDT